VRSGVVTLSNILPDGEPPSEFRVFVRGLNDTSKGEFIFDEAAAASVMAAYQEHGADVMIDLEHLSLEDTARSLNFDPDARGWAKLEIRNGELWAVGVRWAPDGDARLREKRQRYISPAFTVDESGRVAEIINIAITAMPATHGLVPLVAASAAIGGERNAMNAEQMAALAEALGLGGDANVEDVIAAIGALMAKVKAGVEGEEPEAEAEAPAEMSEEPEQMAGAVDEDKLEAKALRSQLLRDTGAPTAMQALSQVAAWKASHLALEAEKVKLAKERAAMEAGERKALVADLVKLGAETPATCGLASGRIVKRLADEPIAELRDRVAALSKSRGVTSSPKAPVSGAVELSARELAMCASMNIDPKDYAARKASAKKGS